MHLSSKNEQNDITANSVLTMRVKNASFLSEVTTTFGGGRETREVEAEANTDSLNTAAMKANLKSIGAWRDDNLLDS